VAITNDAAVANRLVRLRSHGITRVPEEMSHVPDGPWYYQQLDLGFNYRMTDIQAALGLSQIQRLDEFVAKRKEIARRYNELLPALWLTTPLQGANTDSAWHLYIVRLKRDQVKFTQRDIFERLRNSGILVNLHYIPIYRHPFFENMGFKKNDFPAAEAYYAEAISLPIYSALSEEQQLEVVERVKTPVGYQTLF
jgi:dTDP-4-amino-4,6-dideoxygalactose transaminase